MMFVVTLVALLLSVQAEVVELTVDNFETFFDSPYTEFNSITSPLLHEWFIMFYAPWCGHCKRSKPAFTNFQYEIRRNVTIEAQEKGLTDAEDIEIQLQKMVHIALVNCDDEKALCSYFSVRGYPTFLYLTSDRNAINYRGQRTVSGFTNFVSNHDPDTVETANWHTINTGILSTLQSIFGNHAFMFVALFLIVPFLFGYCFMSQSSQKKQKNNEEGNENKEIEEKKIQGEEAKKQAEEGQSKKDE